MKKENQGTSWDKRKAMFLGVATAGLLLGNPLVRSVEGFSMPELAGSGLELKDSNNLTDYRNIPPFPERSKEPPFYFADPEDAQGTPGGETSQPAENLSSSQKTKRASRSKEETLDKITSQPLNMRPDRNAELSQRDALHYPLESTGITISDSRRQYENMGTDTLPRPTAADVKRILESKKFQKKLRSVFQKPEAVELLLLLAKDNRSKEILKEITHSITLDEHLVKFVVDQCQDRKVMNALAPLTNNEELMDRICSLTDVQDVERIKRDLEARQEEARSHNLDAAQESFKRPKGFARKLLSDNGRSDLENSIKAIQESYRKSSGERDNNVALVREVKRSNQDSTSVNLKLMFATAGLVVACFSVGLYFSHQGQKAAGEAKEKLHKVQIDQLNKKNQKLEDKYEWALDLIEKQRQEINKLKLQLLLPAAPVNKEQSPPRMDYSLPKEEEPSSSSKGSSQTEDWTLHHRRRSRRFYGNVD